MKGNERRKIADIVEAFGKINQNIHSAFDAMSEFLGKIKKFNNWKKDEPGKQKTRKGYSDFMSFTKGRDNWYYLNYYGEYKGKVIGFTFVIGVEYDKEDEKEYLELIKTLNENINPNTPMLLICGIYKTAGEIEKAKIVDDDGWHYVDDILRLTLGWKEFDKKNISLGDWIDVAIKYNNEDENYLKEMGWYKSARVKIMHITDVYNEAEAQSIIDDLIKKADEPHI